MRAKRGAASHLFWSLCEYPVSTDECFIWPYAKTARGYAVMHDGERTHIASRLLCEKVHGPPPGPDFDAAHKCGEKACLNAGHISWKTRAGNEADKVAHGRSNRGERCGNAFLTRQDVIAIRGSADSQSTLADRFGTTQQNIHCIQRRKTWAWL